MAKAGGAREHGPRKARTNEKFLQVRAADLWWIHDLALSASRPTQFKGHKLGEIPRNQWNWAACQAIVEITSELLSTCRSKNSR